MITLSIVIVSFKVKSFLHDCLKSIEHYPPNVTFDVFVVDNHSQDGTVDMVKKEFSWVKLIASQKNLGFAKGNNIALDHVEGEFVLLLNPDTEVLPHTLSTLVKTFRAYPHAGAMGPRLLNPDGSLQPSCKQFPRLRSLIFNHLFLDTLFPKHSVMGAYEMNGWSHDQFREVDQPMGAALIVRKKVIDEIGFMDERFYMFFDEVDWCYRIKQAGYKIYFTPATQIIHHGGQSIRQAEMRMSYYWHKSLKQFFAKHYHIPEWGMNIILSVLWMIKILMVPLLLIACVSIVRYLLNIFS